MTIKIGPLHCFQCRHYTGKRRCAAFPDGIPDDIWWDSVDHRKPHQGDHGIRFEPIEDDQVVQEGSDKSGHYGHAGRPGKVGGSLPKTGGGFPDGVLDRLYNSEMAQAVREKVNRRYGDDNRLELELMAANNKLTVEEYTAQTEARVGQLLSESTIAIRAPIDALDDILEDGELQPWTDTKHSGGYKKRDRLQMEEDVLGVPPDARGRDRPIYGYYTMDVDGKSANNVFLGQYGDVIIKLKEATKDRASFTDSDSLDMGMYKRLYASPARTPSIYSLYGLTNSTDVLWLYSNQGPDDGTYWEAQVWGGVTLADIEEIILPSAPDERMAGLLEQAQVPWRVR